MSPKPALVIPLYWSSSPFVILSETKDLVLLGKMSILNHVILPGFVILSEAKDLVPLGKVSALPPVNLTPLNLSS